MTAAKNSKCETSVRCAKNDDVAKRRYDCNSEISNNSVRKHRKYEQSGETSEIVKKAVKKVIERGEKEADRKAKSNNNDKINKVSSKDESNIINVYRKAKRMCEYDEENKENIRKMLQQYEEREER